MRIAIDYTPAIAQGAGIGRYTRSLVDAMVRLHGGDNYLLFPQMRRLPHALFRKMPMSRRALLDSPGDQSAIAT